jgi:hypothetical protein
MLSHHFLVVDISGKKVYHCVMHNKFQRWAAFLILLFFMNFLFGQEKEEPKEEEPKEKQAVSIIKFIPGAQQIKSGKYLKGGILLSAFTAAVIGVIIENKRGNDLYEKYMESTDVKEIVSLRKQTEKKFKNRNYYIAGIFGIWLLHLLDLKFFKNKKGGIKSEVTKKNISIGLYYTF